MKISVENFSGTQPKKAPHLLDANQAQLAENARVEKSDVRSWRDSDLVANLTDSSWETLYKYITADEGIGEQWVTSTYDLDFAENPLAADAFERVYFSGGSDAVPQAFANDLDSDPWVITDTYKIGPAKPVDTGTWGFVSGHDGGSEYRAYVYTYVSRYGEETGPIATVLETEVYDGTSNVVIEDFTQPPAGYGLRGTVGSNIPYVRIYRTNSSVSGAEFQYVGQFNATTHTFGTSTFTDNVADEDLGEVIPTELYEGIQSNLSGLMSLSNGIFAGFVGNELYLSEPYLPHAWTDEYVLSFDYDIVGLG